MIFHEIYGRYYAAVAEILRRISEGTLAEHDIPEITAEKAFAESVLQIPDALLDGTWPLLYRDADSGRLKSVLRNKPFQPLSLLQKRWLKSILLDDRVQLFLSPETDLKELDNVDPLFTPDDFVYFDRYSDGDDFTGKEYIKNFRTVLRAIKEKRWITVSFSGGRGKHHEWRCIPLKLEYSSKDDKFRLLINSPQERRFINMGRVISVRKGRNFSDKQLSVPERRQEKIVCELTDGRNALERFMLLFSYLKKETRKTGDDKYEVTLFCDKDDESEMIIRILSFGYLVKVVSPDSFRRSVAERIRRQIELFRRNSGRNGVCTE
ncbi:MAG: WYL domain-containing protein [Elusimicrobiales bacterium]|jgi:hypothetical protein|nr:WYL domain-containing protein [Elusimicrobiales bacterium]